MNYNYKKLGLTKKEWVDRWKKELQHRNWSPEKSTQYIDEQIEIFKQGGNNEQKESMD